MKFLLVLAVIVGIVIVGAMLVERDDNVVFRADPRVESNERTVGDPDVFERIASSRSCTALQEEFDIAMDNAEAREPGDPLRDVSLSYANAANNRMEAVGCYG